MNKINVFRKTVWAHYRKQGRHDLPWRKTHDPYRILVSEIMLQQTQVERVLSFYTKFIKKFPTAKKLAKAPLADVLKAWQGLGYNRRAKMLHAAAKELVDTARFDTRSNLVERLEELPGVGPYTARAVAAFAYNEDVIFVETNIRTAIIHHFFSNPVQHQVLHKRIGQHQVLAKVSDAEIEKILKKVFPKGRAREWYSALMDYGSYLKRTGISHNARSKGYVKQTKFSGSLRQARGALLRALSTKPHSAIALVNLLGAERRAQLRTALAALVAEGLVKKNRGRYEI